MLRSPAARIAPPNLQLSVSVSDSTVIFYKRKLLNARLSFEKNALPALGMIPGIAPNAEQTQSSYTQICTSALQPTTTTITQQIIARYTLRSP